MCDCLRNKTKNAYEKKKTYKSLTLVARMKLSQLKTAQIVDKRLLHTRINNLHSRKVIAVTVPFLIIHYHFT